MKNEFDNARYISLLLLLLLCYCSDTISVKALQLAPNQCADVLTSCFNNYIVMSSLFTDELKQADIVSIHKKGSTSDKDNYRTISLLPAVS